MKKPLSSEVGRQSALACTLLLALACTGTIVSSDGPGGPQGNPGDHPGAGGSTSGSGGSKVSGSGGAITTPDPPTDLGTVVSNPKPFAPAPGVLRRLTRAQFHNAIKDVFGFEVDVNSLDPDSWHGRFASVGATTVETTDQGVEQYNAAIESAVNAVFSDTTKRTQFLGCTPTGQANDTCVRGYIQKLGQRAWRRPLESAELDRFVSLAASASTALGSPTEGARWATVALFSSPSFIYRPEIGTAGTNGVMRLSGYEVASRLSFLIWNSLPDQMLLDQAANGMLNTADGIRTAATRLLTAAAGRESVAGFADEYMRVDRIATQAKDPSFTEYTPALQAAMVRDMRDTWASLAFDDESSILDVFSTNKVVVNADLAKFYGVDATGLTATTYATRMLPADGPRVGILSKAGFLSQFANQKYGSPTLRGRFIRESLMCGTVPNPPGDVNTAAIDLPTDKPMTRRQRLEMHRAQASCAGCHALMDPLGLPLESFDAVGKYRTTDNGLPVDPSGGFDGKDVANARELGMVASKSVTVAQCLVRSYYSYAVGHEEREEDGSVLNSLATSFKAGNLKMRDLILAVVTHDAFTSVAPQPQ